MDLPAGVHVEAAFADLSADHGSLDLGGLTNLAESSRLTLQPCGYILMSAVENRRSFPGGLSYFSIGVSTAAPTRPVTGTRLSCTLARGQVG